MITVRKSNERGVTRLDWLESYHTFSFGDYEDPAHANFKSLRVLNEDTVQPGKGFDTHFHRDAEILTYVLEGALAHNDSMGHSGTIVPGMIQMMSAGKGIEHSENNASLTDPVHFVQIWILPQTRSLSPQYQQKTMYLEDYLNKLCLLVSSKGRDNSLVIHQDVELFSCVLHRGKKIRYKPSEDRSLWVQFLKGNGFVNGVQAGQGDGVAVTAESSFYIEAREDIHFLLFVLV